MQDQSMKETRTESGERTRTGLGFVSKILATTVCVACYIVLWSLGFAAGFLLPLYVSIVAAAVYHQILASVVPEHAGSIFSKPFVDIVTPIFVGAAGKLLVGLTPLSVTPIGAYAIVCIVLCGGMIFGLLRRRLLFVGFFAHPVVMVIGVIGEILLAMTVIFVVLVVLTGVLWGLAVPEDVITPSVVVKGWTPTKPVSHTGRKWISYHKGGSRVQVSGELGAVTDEEARAVFEETGHVTLSAVGPMSELDHSDIIMPDGDRRHTRHYRFEAAERIELVEHYFYCDELEISVCAFAWVRGEPFEQLLHEAREMLDSLRCPH